MKAKENKNEAVYTSKRVERYRRRLKRYYFELLRRERHGLPITPSTDALNSFFSTLLNVQTPVPVEVVDERLVANRRYGRN